VTKLQKIKHEKELLSTKQLMQENQGITIWYCFNYWAMWLYTFLHIIIIEVV